MELLTPIYKAINLEPHIIIIANALLKIFEQHVIYKYVDPDNPDTFQKYLQTRIDNFSLNNKNVI